MFGLLIYKKIMAKTKEQMQKEADDFEKEILADGGTVNKENFSFITFFNGGDGIGGKKPKKEELK